MFWHSCALLISLLMLVTAPIGAPQHFYADPEFSSSGSIVWRSCWNCNAKIWLSQMDADTGDFIPGADRVIANRAIPLVNVNENGPEWMVNNGEDAVVFTTSNNGPSRIVVWGQESNTYTILDFKDNQNRVHIDGSDNGKVLYYLDGDVYWSSVASPVDNPIPDVSYEVNLPTWYEHDVLYTSFVNGFGQIMSYDTEAGSVRQLTSTQDADKFGPYAWDATECGENARMFSAVTRLAGASSFRSIRLYCDDGYDVVEYARLTPTEPGSIGSVEPYISDGQSHLSLNIWRSIYDASIWVWPVPVELGGVTLPIRLDDPNVIAGKRDPEVWVAGDNIWVYYYYYVNGKLILERETAR
jgi:hypothetical protein